MTHTHVVSVLSLLLKRVIISVFKQYYVNMIPLHSLWLLSSSEAIQNNCKYIWFAINGWSVCNHWCTRKNHHTTAVSRCPHFLQETIYLFSFSPAAQLNCFNSCGQWAIVECWTKLLLSYFLFFLLYRKCTEPWPKHWGSYQTVNFVYRYALSVYVSFCMWALMWIWEKHVKTNALIFRTPCRRWYFIIIFSFI